MFLPSYIFLSTFRSHPPVVDQIPAVDQTLPHSIPRFDFTTIWYKINKATSARDVPLLELVFSVLDLFIRSSYHFQICKLLALSSRSYTLLLTLN